jgi:hypothetical protein
MSAEGPLACSRCGATYALEERFCAECGMPLVHAGRDGDEPVSEAHERARKVKPQYARGELVKVAMGQNQAEAEMIQGMLLEEGIPSMLRRMRGFDVPDFLAAGPRDVMVPDSAREVARGLLEDVDARSAGAATSGAGAAGASTPFRLLAAILAVLMAGVGISLLLLQLTS